jgi:hypothetical protein
MAMPPYGGFVICHAEAATPAELRSMLSGNRGDDKAALRPSVDAGARYGPQSAENPGRAA